MNLLKGIETKIGDEKTEILKLINNLYKKIQVERIWDTYFTDKLLTIRFKKSDIDECILFWGLTVFAYYVDNSIFSGTCNEENNQAIQDVKKIWLDIRDKGYIVDYLRVNVDNLPYGQINISQPKTIQDIINQMDIPLSVTTR